MKYLLLLAIFAVFFTLPASVDATTPQWKESHGGDPLALEFVARAWKLTEDLATANGLEEIITAEDVAHMQDELKRTSVVVLDTDLYVNDRVVTIKHTGEYDPDGSLRHKIEINRHLLYDWLQRGGGLRRIVFHELLWLIDKDDTDYQISRRLKNNSQANIGVDLTRSICAAGRQ